AETLVLSLPFIVVMILNEKRWWKVIAVIAIVVLIFMLMMLQSISTMVAIALGLFTFLSCLFNEAHNLIKSSRRLRLTIVASAFILIILILFWLTTRSFHSLKQKINSVAILIQEPHVLTDKKSYNSFTERWLAWKHTVLMIRKHPIIGSGTANWKV